MAAIDEILARIERQEAAQRLHRNEAEQGQCPSCGYRSDLDDFEVDDNSGDDSDKWETSEEAGRTDGDDNAGEGDPDDYNDRKNLMNRQQNKLTPEEKLARALVESAARNSTNPQHQQVNRPAQKPSAQRAQATTQPLAEENAALVLARAIAELRGEKR